MAGVYFWKENEERNMKIIAVNVKDNIKNMSTVKQATQRAWKLNINKAKQQEYVVGVVLGVVKGHFKIEGASYDEQEKGRVAFELKECSLDEISSIDKFINDVNLKGIVTKYI